MRSVVAPREGACHTAAVADAGAGREAAEAQLLELLAGRGRVASPDRRAAIDDEIAAVAAVLGLDPREVDDLANGVVAAERAPGALMGRFRVTRLAREVMPFWIGLLLAPMLAGLGAPVPGALLLVAVVGGFFVHARRRASVFDIDALGRIEFRHHRPLDWPHIAEITFALQPPLGFSLGSRPAQAGTTMQLRFQRSDGSTLRVARGQVFQIRPTRRPIGYDQLSRHLRAAARRAGMVVETTDSTRAAWRAARRV